MLLHQHSLRHPPRPLLHRHCHALCLVHLW
jgi:hypothetical protein